MPEWLQILTGVMSVLGPIVSALWVARQARQQSQEAAVDLAERLTKIEARLDSLVESRSSVDVRVNNHADRLRQIEIAHAANHGAVLKEVSHA